MDQFWDGVTRTATVSAPAAAVRHALADHAWRYNWGGVFDVLLEEPSLVNSWRPDGRSWFAPLHQVAHGGQPVEIASRLISLGAWRSLRSADGERPVDIAERLGHEHLVDVLRPRAGVVEPDVVNAIQAGFHTVIRTRVAALVDEHALRLPELEVLFDLDDPAMSFRVPGMVGGFIYRLMTDSDGVRLVSESWSRVVGGSGQRHEITPDRITLIEEGFV